MAIKDFCGRFLLSFLANLLTIEIGFIEKFRYLRLTKLD